MATCGRRPSTDSGASTIHRRRRGQDPEEQRSLRPGGEGGAYRSQGQAHRPGPGPPDTSRPAGRPGRSPGPVRPPSSRIPNGPWPGRGAREIASASQDCATHDARRHESVGIVAGHPVVEDLASGRRCQKEGVVGEPLSPLSSPEGERQGEQGARPGRPAREASADRPIADSPGLRHPGPSTGQVRGRGVGNKERRAGPACPPHLRTLPDY